MKIVLVGDTQVGKTCLIRRLTNGVYTEHNNATIGAAFQNHMIQTKKGSITLQIWDTAGQERFRALAPMYYRSASVAVLCFDLTNRRTFETLEEWVLELSEKSVDSMKIVICGNKKDLTEEREISYEEGVEFADSHNADFYAETSSKTGEGVNELFIKIAEIGDQDTVPVISTPSSVKIPDKNDGKEKSVCC